MDYSAANTTLWNPVIQFGLIAVLILLANILRRKIPAVRKSMLPTAVLAGFVLLALKLLGIVNVDTSFLEMLTYHGIAIGFIALSLRVPEDSAPRRDHVGLRSGAIIVGSYMIQAIFGILISLVLVFTILPDFFPAAGLLLPMGFGQGPGQANNVGTTYEGMGFAGGRSFGLAIAAAGYLCACIVGVFYLNYLNKKGKLVKKDAMEYSEKASLSTFQDQNEAPIADSVDRLSIQVCLVLLVYIITYLVTKTVTGALSTYAPGLASLLNSLLWGFNFMIGSGFAILTRVLMKKMRNAKIMNHQYQNNYLLSRISGLAFDVMIVAGIGSIDINDLSGLWLPFGLMVLAGAVVTLLHLKFVCKYAYRDYYYEGLISMYGMMTGTISSGVLLLRELDPMMETPAANNLVVGSSFAILLGAPLLLAVSLAAQSLTALLIIFAIVVVYYLLLVFIAVHHKSEVG